MFKRLPAVVFSLLSLTAVTSFGQPSALVVDGAIESTSAGFRFPDGSLQASAAVAPEPRRFYLSSAQVQGDAPLFVCAAGFHMASLWELVEVSLLEYRADHPDAAAPTADMGDGPPSGTRGWVRTGGAASVVSQAGVGNCDGWQSQGVAGFDGGALGGGGIDSGSLAQLNDSWGQAATAISPWLGSTDGCASMHPVWCIED